MMSRFELTKCMHKLHNGVLPKTHGKVFRSGSCARCTGNEHYFMQRVSANSEKKLLLERLHYGQKPSWVCKLCPMAPFVNSSNVLSSHNMHKFVFVQPCYGIYLIVFTYIVSKNKKVFVFFVCIVQHNSTLQPLSCVYAWQHCFWFNEVLRPRIDNFRTFLRPSYEYVLTVFTTALLCHIVVAKKTTLL